jgi:hypothetical protein
MSAPTTPLPPQVISCTHKHFTHGKSSKFSRVPGLSEPTYCYYMAAFPWHFRLKNRYPKDKGSRLISTQCNQNSLSLLIAPAPQKQPAPSAPSGAAKWFSASDEESMLWGSLLVATNGVHDPVLCLALQELQQLLTEDPCFGAHSLLVTGDPPMVSSAPSAAWRCESLYNPSVSSERPQRPMPSAPLLMLEATAARVETAEGGTCSPSLVGVPEINSVISQNETTQVVTRVDMSIQVLIKTGRHHVD